MVALVFVGVAKLVMREGVREEGDVRRVGGPSETSQAPKMGREWHHASVANELAVVRAWYGERALHGCGALRTRMVQHDVASGCGPVAYQLSLRSGFGVRAGNCKAAGMAREGAPPTQQLQAHRA